MNIPNHIRPNDLYEHLKAFLTDERKELFERVIQMRTRHLTVVLEDIYQPHNASAVLRSCDCFGVQDVHIIEKDHEYEVNPGVALGASKWLTMHKYSETGALNTCVTNLKDKGYHVVATTPHHDQNTIQRLPIDKPIALMFGTEVHGLSERAIELADSHVVIPMHGFTESFNISVSAAICLHDLTTRLHSSEVDWKLSAAEQEDLLLEWAQKSIKSSDKILERFLTDERN